MLPDCSDGIPRAAGGLEVSGIDNALPDGGILFQPANLPEQFARGGRDEEVSPWISFLSKSGVGSADERHPGQPGIVKLGRRLAQMSGTCEIPDGDRDIHVGIIVPPRSFAHLQSNAGVVENPGQKLRRGDLPGQI